MRFRSAALAGAVALVAGGGVGYAVSLTGSSARNVVATAPLSGNAARSQGSYGAAGGAGAASSAIAEPVGAALTPVFNRQANGIDIRGFLVGSPPAPPAGVVTCAGIGPRFQAELSTQKMVGIAGSGFVPQQLGPMILTEQPSVLGEAEGDPVAVVVVETNPSVANVRMDFTGGNKDEMQPVKGWSVLAAPTPALQTGKTGPVAIGTLTARDSSGHTLVSSPITWPPAAPAPLPLPAVTNGGSGSGVASSGSVGSGTASSGEATYPCAVPAPTQPPPRTGTVTPCAPPTTVQGEIYACSTPAPAPEPTSTSPQKSGG